MLLILLAVVWFTGHRTAIPFLAIIGLLDLFNIPLRDIIARPRPTSDEVGVIIGYGGIQGDSFPSGHALHVVLFYGFFMYISKQIIKSDHIRTALYIVLGIYLPLSGVWLIFDGRHWFSDVLGGYTYGIFYLLLIIVAHKRYVPWAQRLKNKVLANPSSSNFGRVTTVIVKNIT